jgi:hypothetical protein
MNGGSRLSAIDRSTPAMSRALPDLPMRETVLVRLLWLCLSGMGIFCDRVWQERPQRESFK